MIAQPTKKFMDKLTVYVRWAACSTPFSSHEQMGHKPAFMTSVPPEAAVSPTAAEVLFAFETHGTKIAGCTQPCLLTLYQKGKANRDFWTKEVGWWRKEGFFVQEEFLCYLTPECFVELFGRFPRSHTVRLFHDNNYSVAMWNEDLDWILKGFERTPQGVEILVR